MSTGTADRSYLRDVESSEVVRSKWGWFVALGVVFLILALLAFANLFLATIVSVYYVGILMLVGGVGYLVHAFQVRHWGGFFLWLLSGLLLGIAGFIAFYNPLLAAAVITLALAAALIVSGVLRLVAGFQLRPLSGWGWIVASGVISLLAGIVFALGWPVNTLWLLGIVLAIDLTFQGVSLIALGFTLKSAR